MRDNEKVRLVGSAVELVPYERIFVERYHQWMQDAFLLDMTASEPLTIEQEYEMQKSWREDPDKCTFILLSKKNESGEVGDDEVNRMIGDVNLFVSQRFYEWVGEDQVEREEKNAEVDIMVAEKTSRGRGIGFEAVKLMLWYGARHLEISRFFAKINKSNEPSIKLFRRLGFKETHYVAAFEEYEFQLCLHEEPLQTILTEVDQLCPFQAYPIY